MIKKYILTLNVDKSKSFSMLVNVLTSDSCLGRILIEVYSENIKVADIVRSMYLFLGNIEGNLLH